MQIGNFFKGILVVSILGAFLSCTSDDPTPNPISYPTYAILGTNQTTFFDTIHEIAEPAIGEPFYGQNAHYAGIECQYTVLDDWMVKDEVSELEWLNSPDLNRDSAIDSKDKLTYSQAITYADTCTAGGYSDWRLPHIKELYSLIQFSGRDIDPASTSANSPFIDTNYFDFAYGDLSVGERIIDAQFASSTFYMNGMDGMTLLFGVNFADGRIKGYGLINPLNPTLEKTFYVYLVRGNSEYGISSFTEHGNGTISDSKTGLMWSQNDSEQGMTWPEALIYAENATLAGYSDWRLPDSKELHSLVDYNRSPDLTQSPAIDPNFSTTEIINEKGELDYPYFWTSTTHANNSPTPGGYAAYISFGRALGYMNGQWIDIHGAGAQRSDPKTGNAADYPFGHGPQGDAIRIYNYVRLVRTIQPE